MYPYNIHCSCACLQEGELIDGVVILGKQQAGASRRGEALQYRVVVQHRDPLVVILVLRQNPLAELLRESSRQNIFLHSPPRANQETTPHR